MIAAIVGADPGKYTYFAELETAGKCVEWAMDKFGIDSFPQLNEMIKNSGISRRTFYRYWKMYHQESPHEFMRNCFLSNAGQMLLETSLSVNEIANALGFQNTSHFFVLFKKYVGMSPLQFRKSAAKDIPHIPYDKI